MDAATSMHGFSYLQKELELKQNLVGEGFARPPTDGRIRVNVLGEINRAEKFEGEKVYISYELDKPSYWLFDSEDEDYSHEPHELLVELNRHDLRDRTSITNIATPNIVYQEGESIPVFNYSFPIDWQFTVDANYLIEKWPKIILQVNSLDDWGRYRIEGYGFVELPRYAGLHHIKVKTWKPHETQESKTFSYFLGGSTRVKDPKDIAKTSHRLDYDEDAIVNRYGTISESAGTIYLTLNIIKQSEALMQETRKNFREVKHKEKLEELRIQNDEAYGLGRTGGPPSPTLMSHQNFGHISRFSAM